MHGKKYTTLLLRISSALRVSQGQLVGVLLQLVAQALHFRFHQVDLLRQLDGAILQTRARNALVRAMLSRLQSRALALVRSGDLGVLDVQGSRCGLHCVLNLFGTVPMPQICKKTIFF